MEVSGQAFLDVGFSSRTEFRTGVVCGVEDEDVDFGAGVTEFEAFLETVEDGLDGGQGGDVCCCAA